MKIVLSIFLTGIVLMASMSETTIFLAFNANQSNIIQNFCINRNAPEKKCDGKCYLKDRLAENDGEDNAPSSSSLFEETLKINFFPNIFQVPKINQEALFASCIFIYRELNSQNFPSISSPPPEA